MSNSLPFDALNLILERVAADAHEHTNLREAILVASFGETGEEGRGLSSQFTRRTNYETEGTFLARERHYCLLLQAEHEQRQSKTKCFS